MAVAKDLEAGRIEFLTPARRRMMTPRVMVSGPGCEPGTSRSRIMRRSSRAVSSVPSILTPSSARWPPRPWYPSVVSRVRYPLSAPLGPGNVRVIVARLFRRGAGGSSRSSTRPGPGRKRCRSRSRSTGRPSSGWRAGRMDPGHHGLMAAVSGAQAPPQGAFTALM